MNCEVLPALVNADESKGLLVENGYRKCSTYCKSAWLCDTDTYFLVCIVVGKIQWFKLWKDEETVFLLGNV